MTALLLRNSMQNFEVKNEINRTHHVVDFVFLMNFERWIVASYQVGRRSPRMKWVLPESMFVILVVF